MDYESSVRLPLSEFERRENTALTLESCANLEFTFTSWGMYAVDCPPDQVCVKTILDNGFDENGRHEYITGSRGCAMRNSSRGEKHWMGCGVYKTNIVPPSETQDQWDLVCFCDTDYCNKAMRNEQVNLMLMLVMGYVISLSFLTVFQLR